MSTNFMEAVIDVKVDTSKVPSQLEKVRQSVDSGALNLENKFTEASKKTVDGFNSIEKAAKMIFTGSLVLVISRTLVGLTDLTTGILKAKREGQDLGQTIADGLEKAIPVIGRAYKAGYELGKELWGINAQLDKMSKQSALRSTLRGINQSIDYEMLSAGAKRLVDDTKSLRENIEITQTEISKAKKEIRSYTEEQIRLQKSIQAKSDGVIFFGPEIAISRTRDEDKLKKVNEQLEIQNSNLKAEETLREKLEKYQEHLKSELTKEVTDKTDVLALDSFKYRMKLIREEIKYYKDAGVDIITLSKYQVAMLQEAFEEFHQNEIQRQKEQLREIEDAQKASIENIQSMRDMSLQERIEALEIEKQKILENYDVESETLKLINEEQQRYRDQNITGWGKYTAELKNWQDRSLDWGNNLADITTNALDSTADSLADMMMQTEVDWKSLGRTVIKEILAMIVKMQLLYVWQLLTRTSGVGTTNSSGAVSSVANSTMSEGATHMPGLADGGTVEKTGLAVVHEGETFSGVGKSLGSKVVVNVNGAAQAGVSVAVDDYEKSDQRIIDVTLMAAQSNGTYRRAHKGLRR